MARNANTASASSKKRPVDAQIEYNADLNSLVLTLDNFLGAKPISVSEKGSEVLARSQGFEALELDGLPEGYTINFVVTYRAPKKAVDTKTSLTRKNSKESNKPASVAGPRGRRSRVAADDE